MNIREKYLSSEGSETQPQRDNLETFLTELIMQAEANPNYNFDPKKFQTGIEEQAARSLSPRDK